MTRNMKEIFAVVKRNNGKSYWTRIGVAFENADASWNLLFDFIPTSGSTTIQLRDPKRAERTETEEAASEA